MMSRLLFRQIGNVHKQDLRLFPSLFARSRVTEAPTQLTNRTRRWAIRRYALFIGLPLTSFLIYRLSAGYQTQRKYAIVFESLGRVIRVISIGIRTGIDHKFSLLFKRQGTDEYITALQAWRRRNARRFAHLCIDNGGVYIKIGQAFINLPEVIPLEYYEELQVLQERALRRQTGEIDVLFKRYFHDTPENIYAKFNRTPIAAASLAEVYEAETKDGQRVAVKVQYSDLRERFETDIATIKILFSLLEWFNPTWTLAWMIDELHDDLVLELDFLHEARNSERCRDHLKDLDYVHVPKVHWDLTKKRIITYGYAEGVTIDHVTELKKMNLSLKDIDEKLIRIFAEQIFRTGFVHADPHAGNVHVRALHNPKSTTPSQAQIVLLDHGLYESLLNEERKILCDLWMASLTNDHALMRQTATALGAPEKDYEVFCTLLTMKPLPDTEAYEIPSYASNWDPLPHEIQMIALKKGKFQLPTDDEYKNVLTDDERAEVRKYFRKLMDKKRLKLFRILKQMPKTMFLLLRNLNAVRNTVRAHNVSDVDRTLIMTEVCQRALKEFPARNTRL